MRTILKSIIAIFVFSLFFACSSNPTEKFIGTWKLDGESFKEEMKKTQEFEIEKQLASVPDSLKEQTRAQIEAFMSPEALVKMITPMIENASFTFNEKDYVINFAGKETKGTWSYDVDTKNMIVTEEGKEKADTNVVEEITDEKMTFVVKTGETEMKFTLLKDKK